MTSVVSGQSGRSGPEQGSRSEGGTGVPVGDPAVPTPMVTGRLEGTAVAPDRLDAKGIYRQGRQQASRLRRHLVAGDIVGVVAAWTPQAFVHSARGSTPQIACAAAAAAATVLAIRQAGLYRARVCAVRSLETLRVIVAATIGACVFAACEWLALAGVGRFGFSAVARPLEGAAGAALAVLVLRWRFGRWLKSQRSTGRFLRTVVLVGTNDDAIGVWHLVNEEPQLGYRVGAVAGQERTDAPWAGTPTCPDLDELPALAERVGASGVIIVGNALTAGVTSEVVDRATAAGLHVQIWPGFARLSARRVRMAPVLGVPVLYVEPKDAPKWAQVVKRVMDVALVLALAPIALPVTLAAAVLVKLEDGGPVLHHHRVVGRFGAPITVLKIRTMVPNAAQMMPKVAALNERSGGPLFKASSDPRVTKVGRLLRASSIDELPQLWSVLNGTMSLVGPRFALPSEVEHFDEELRRRHEMRPGMTGLWQSEARDNPFFSAYRRLDLFYVDNWSLSLDVAILFNTLHGVAVQAMRAALSVVGPKHAAPGPSGDLVPQRR
ncbi:MAG: exopolysaccharide biosynthesis polyprenyl glycosylphosphotransferase [Acidimicrobiales bacterium]